MSKTKFSGFLNKHHPVLLVSVHGLAASPPEDAAPLILSLHLVLSWLMLAALLLSGSSLKLHAAVALDVPLYLASTTARAS